MIVGLVENHPGLYRKDVFMKSISWDATNKKHEFNDMIASAYHHPSHSEKKMVKI